MANNILQELHTALQSMQRSKRVKRFNSYSASMRTSVHLFFMVIKPMFIRFITHIYIPYPPIIDDREKETDNEGTGRGWRRKPYRNDDIDIPNKWQV